MAEEAEKAVKPDDSRLIRTVSMLLDDFLAVDDAFEVSQCVVDLNSPHLHSALVAKVLNLSLDKPETLRKRVPELLSSLHVRHIISGEDIELGFERFSAELADIIIDVPRILEFYSDFVAQALESKILPESFLENAPGLIGNEWMGKKAIKSIRALIELPLPITVVKRRAVVIIEELFSSLDIADAVENVQDLDAPQLVHQVVKRAVSMSMDRKESERELISKFLVALVSARVCSEDQIMEGFIRLLVAIDDLALDAPSAASILSNFISRAIVDEIVVPSFFKLIPTQLTASGRGAEVAASVKLLLERSHAAHRLAGIWGTPKHSSVADLKAQIVIIVEEYFLCGDRAECARCLKQLDVPLFSHEFVKRLLVMSLEKGEKERERAIDILVFLVRSSQLSHHQMQQGFLRVVNDLDDIALDLPDAAKFLAEIMQTLVSAGCLSVTFRSHVWGSRSRPGSLDRVLSISSLIFDEFCLIDDTAEAARSFLELGAPHLHGEVVTKIFLTALDRDDHAQNLAPKLIAALHVRGVFTSTDIQRGLDLILKEIPDLQLDVPACEDMFAKFVSKLLEDRCVPELYLSSLSDTAPAADLAVSIAQKITAHIALPLPITTAKSVAKKLLSELFVSGEIDECVTGLAEIKMPLYGHEVIRIAVTAGVEGRDRDRELVSLLLAKLNSSGTARHDQFMEGFVRVLSRLPDISLDTPDAPRLVGNFLARTIVDEVVPKNFLQLIPEQLVTEGGSGEAIRVATVAVEQKHAGTRLGAIWGGRTVEEMQKYIELTILEYFDTREVSEAVRCIREMQVPLFTHEVVRRILLLLIERRKGDEDITLALNLVSALLQNAAIDLKAIAKGVNRVVMSLPDLSLDVPDAPQQIINIGNALAAQKLVDDSTHQNLLTAAQLPR